jgi:hypothetical protein
MSIDSSFAILFESKNALLKKSPNVLFEVSTSTVPYKKNGKLNTGGFSAGRKQDKRTTVFFGCYVVDIKCKKRTFKTALLALMEQNQQLHADKI